jgi:hypothetical protein
MKPLALQMQFILFCAVQMEKCMYNLRKMIAHDGNFVVCVLKKIAFIFATKHARAHKHYFDQYSMHKMQEATPDSIIVIPDIYY